MNDTPKSVRAAWNMICPSCKQDHSLDIAATVHVRLCPDGTDAYASREGGHVWSSESPATCAACGWTGTVKDAETACAAFGPTASIITPGMVKTGEVYVEVYPMVRDSEGTDGEGARLTTDAHETPDFYDVWLRPDDWETNDSNTYAEWDDLSLAEASAKVTELERQYPGIAVNWVNS